MSKSRKHRVLDVTMQSVEDTQVLAEMLGRFITDGIVIALIGNLGSGKTTFVQGLARGLQVPAEYYITSPTFTLINEYPGRLPLHHVDLYRIDRTEELEDIGLHDIMRGDGVTVIEWAERILSELPIERIQIHFELTDDQCRQMKISATGSIAVTVIELIDKTVREKKWV